MASAKVEAMMRLSMVRRPIPFPLLRDWRREKPVIFRADGASLLVTEFESIEVGFSHSFVSVVVALY